MASTTGDLPGLVDRPSLPLCRCRSPALPRPSSRFGRRRSLPGSMSLFGRGAGPVATGRGMLLGGGDPTLGGLVLGLLALLRGATPSVTERNLQFASIESSAAREAGDGLVVEWMRCHTPRR